jgi:class 3 adenylate cyclase
MQEPGSLNWFDMNDKAAEKSEEQAAQQFVVRGAGVALVRQETVVLLVDLVESVRLMREHEAVTVRR